MKALVKAKAETGLWMRNEPEPQIGANDVLVKIHKTGICGTDIHIYNWDEWAQRTIPVPLIIGHEYCGEIAELGSNVKKYRVGQRVSGEGHIVGNNSRAARSGCYHMDPDTKGTGVNINGAFAQYLTVPSFNIIPLPEEVNDDLGAILDPLGNAVHTALAFDVIGEDVLITGAGPIGIMAAAVARHVGARHVVITDINPDRLALAEAVVDLVPVNTAKESLKDVMHRLRMTEGFDVGLEMSGAAPAFDLMIESMVMGGNIAMLGLPAKPSTVDWAKIVFKLITIKGIYGREMFETWYKMIAMLQSGLDVSRIITHRMEAKQFEQGFQTMKSGNCGKVVLDWSKVADAA
ncbi:MAG: L-threonine 3-dehydrogenase [Alphaproteobacteria bacterium]|nr:L-threonine 3-dehydrogenase [Alphaproteobacteria bacterium]